MRNAIVVAALLEVLCPHCGDPQPNPSNGAHLWLIDEVSGNQGKRTCVACDEPFILMAQHRVSTSEHAAPVFDVEVEVES